MNKFFHDLFTERDGVSWCLVRVSAIPVLGDMLYKFIMSGSPDYQNFGIGIAAVFATIAAKNQSEKGGM